MGPRIPESSKDFIRRLKKSVEAGAKEIRFGGHHHSHAVCVEDGSFRVRALEHTKEEAEAYLAEHGMFMPENAEDISTPRTLVLEESSLNGLITSMKEAGLI